MDLQTDDLTDAFDLAFRLAYDPSVREREQGFFKKIAHLIWRSAWERGKFSKPDVTGWGSDGKEETT